MKYGPTLIQPDDIERFWSRVELGDPEDCALWGGGVSGSGYGCFTIRGRTILAHRLAYLFAKGPLPKRLVVLHSCHTPLCCNPEHLYLGTHSECRLKMYKQNPEGSRVRFKSRLSPEDFKRAAKAVKSGRPITEVAPDFKISASYLRRKLKSLRLIPEDLRLARR